MRGLLFVLYRYCVIDCTAVQLMCINARNRLHTATLAHTEPVLFCTRPIYSALHTYNSCRTSMVPGKMHLRMQIERENLYKDCNETVYLKYQLDTQVMSRGLQTYSNASNGCMSVCFAGSGLCAKNERGPTKENVCCAVSIHGRAYLSTWYNLGWDI